MLDGQNEAPRLRWNTIHPVGAPESGGERAGKTKNMVERIGGGVETGPPPLLKLAGTFGFWFLASILSSNVKKVVLNAISLPLALTTFQFAATATFSLVYILVFRIAANTVKAPSYVYSVDSRSSPGVLPVHAGDQKGGRRRGGDDAGSLASGLSLRDLLLRVVPLSLTQVAAHFLTSFSMSLVPLSYTHTVKAMGPLFTVVVSTLFLSKTYSRKVWVSLLFILMGVSLASATELVFDVYGLLAAVSAALIGVVQSLYSKFMLSSMSISHVHLLFYSSTISFLLLLPLALVYDGTRVLEAQLAPVSWHLVLLAMTHFSQSIGAFQFLAYVTPLAYAIANTAKRLSIIVSSVLYFSHPVSYLNALGMLIAFGGQAYYGIIKSSGKTGKT